MDALLQNIRFALRQLRRNPGFSAVAATTIALGIGATTVIFSLVNAVVFRPLPVDDPGGLLEVMEIGEDGGPRASISYSYFQEYRDAGADVARLGAFGLSEVAFQGGDHATAWMAMYVSGDYFELLGLTPAHGRFFAPDEERPGVPEPVAVISHALWEGEMGRDPAAVGRTITLNSRPVTVVGVAPPGFEGLVRGLATDVWLPIPMYAEMTPGSDIYAPGRHSWLVMFGRLAPGVSAEPAASHLGTVGRAIAERSETGLTTDGVRVSQYTGIPGPEAGAVRLFLWLLLGTAGLVLLIACVNVAGMLLARATTRRREVGIRLALGAGRRRLVGQLLTESTVLFLVGGVGGVLLAIWLSDLLTVFSSGLPVDLSLHLSPDARVMGSGLLLALATGLAFGLLPALQASRPAVTPALEEGGFATGSRTRLRGAFVAAQIAVSVLLLVTAGLLGRSLQSSLAVDSGMDAEGVVVASVDVGPHGYDREEGLLFFQRYMERLAERPGVQGVTLAQMIPLGFDEIVYGVQVPGHDPPAGASAFYFDYNSVGPAYFSTLGIPVDGREFVPGDGPEAPGVAIVNRTMAERFWPEGRALGERITVGGEEREIVGIAADGRYGSLHEDPKPYVYLPFGQSYGATATVHVRSSEDLARVVQAMREELRALDPNVPLAAPGSLEERIRMTLLPQRIGATLIGIFGLLGLLLAAVGLYGILAYSVSRRTREFGVRIALGARGRNVLAMVLREGALLLAVGLGVGLVLALGAARLLGGLVVGISATDPATFLGAVVVLGAVAFFASYLPARRATKVDPMIALRSD
jgi:predicted permease